MLGKKNVISWNKGTVLNCRQICGIMILFIASSFQCVSIYTKNSHAHMFKWFQQIVSKLSKISGIQRQCHEQIQVFRGNKNPWISTCLWCFQHISHFHFSWSKVPSPLRTWLRFPRSCSWLLAPTDQLIYPNHSGKCTWSVRREFGTCKSLLFVFASKNLMACWSPWDWSVSSTSEQSWFWEARRSCDTAGWPAQLQNDSSSNLHVSVGHCQTCGWNTMKTSVFLKWQVSSS